MYKKFIITIVVLLCGIQLFGQQITIRLRFGMQNSLTESGRQKFIGRVSVATPYATPTVSDDSGRVALTVVGMEMGSLVSLHVEHPDLVVVNAQDVQAVVLGRREPIFVSLAPKSQLAAAQTEYYRISKTALFGRQDAIIADLKGSALQRDATIKVLQAQFYEELENRFDAEDATRAKVEALEAQLEGMAIELAAVNLDRENERYRKAFAQFKKGNLEEVLVILDDSLMNQTISTKLAELAKLQAAPQVDQAAVERVQAELDQEAHNYALKAKAQKLLLFLAEAAASQEKALGVLKGIGLPKGSHRLVDAHQDLGQTYRTQGRDEEAIKEQEQAIVHIQASSRPDSMQLMVSYEEIAGAMTTQGRHDEALQIQNIALSLGIKLLGAATPKLGLLYGQLAHLQLLTHAPELALTTQKTAVAILSAAPGVASRILGGAFRLLGTIFARTGDAVNAIKAVKDAVTFERGGKAPDKRAVAEHLRQVAKLEKEAGNLQNAIKAEKEALEELQQAEPAQHPKKAEVLNELADLHQQTGKMDSALALSKKATTMLDSTLGPRHRTKGKFLQVKSSIELARGTPDQALETLNQALAIQHQDSNATQEELGKSYTQMAEIHIKRGDFEAAAGAQEKAVKLLEKTGGRSSKTLAEDYTKLALIHLRKGNTEAAIEAHRKAIECLQNPETPSSSPLTDQKRYYENLGQVLFGMTQKEAEAFALDQISKKGRKM